MNKLRIIILLIVVAGSAAGCNKWLDAKPRTIVETDQLFSSEKGFEDAMYGVYTTMATNTLYGEQLTMSFLDVLAQQYNCQTGNGLAHNFYQTAQYNYVDDGVKTRI